jgi:Predicted oxidoreductases (related to aryl-alcohol dehydrogenases)
MFHRKIEAEVIPVSEKYGVAQVVYSPLALAWVLRRDNVASALVGASKPSQLEENAKASGVVLPPEAIERIEAILGE